MISGILENKQNRTCNILSLLLSLRGTAFALYESVTIKEYYYQKKIIIECGITLKKKITRYRI